MSEWKQNRFIEIFMDIIYIYALMQSSLMLGELTNGIIGPFAMFSYIILLLILLSFRTDQLTIDDRYGSKSIIRIIAKAVTGFTVLLCANSMNGDWEVDFYPIITTLGIVSVILLAEYVYEYFVHHKDGRGLVIHMGVMALRSALLFGSLMLPYRFGIICAALGICLPWMISSFFKLYQAPAFENPEQVTERLTYTTVLMSGVGIVRLGDYFVTDPFIGMSVPVFGTVLAMIWFYLTEQDGLLDSEKILKAHSNYYYFHYLIWIGAILITVVLNYMIHETASAFFGVILLYIGLLLYFGGILGLTIYNKRRMQLSVRTMYIFLGIYSVALLFFAIFCSNSMVVTVLTFIMTVLMTALFGLQKMAFQSRKRKK